MTRSASLSQLLAANRPLVVGALADPAGLAIRPEGCDLLELRLDSLGTGEAVRRFARESPLPLLITVRGPEEGGVGSWSRADRIAAYQALLPEAALIDIELRDFDHFEPVLAQAREAGVGIVGSFHDFEETPSLEALSSRLDRRADVSKFALMAHSTADIRTHLAFADHLGGCPFSLMGMGPLGAAARPLMAKAGSRLNYGYLGTTPTAPDQWPARLLSETLAL